MNVGNSLGLGINMHLTASYPYISDIGVGVDAYFIIQGNPTTYRSEVSFDATLSFFCTT